ncbi:bifunctional aminoglycoside phosphotransferase/ATP-binding protein [Allosphingosinicella humi]
MAIRHPQIGSAEVIPDHETVPAPAQAETIAFLEGGDAFGAHERPERIDTHAASIFLAGDRAWKLKRAVKFPYLDFSTPERRRVALQAELALNRRTAPELYIAVHPITRTGRGRLAIDGAGEAIDWLLEMRRLPADALLDRRADRGELDDALLTDLAERIVAFHRCAEVVDIESCKPGLLRIVDNNRQSMTELAAILDQAKARRLAERLAELVEEQAPLLDERAQAGRVRHGHGDLHLANIAVIEGRPTPFDCLEFNTDLASIDVLYDLAFVLVDLWQRDLKREANIVFNRYLDLSPADEAGIALMPLFLSLRASIRSLVIAAKSERHGADPVARRLAQDCLDLAGRLIDPVSPRLVAIGGLSGTGKSSLALSLAGHLGRAPGARIVRSDIIRKRMAGVAPEERLPPAHYSVETAATVYRAMRAACAQGLICGQAVIADAVFARREERDEIEAVARQVGIGCSGLWLEAPEPIRVKRVTEREKDASDADATIARSQGVLAIGDLTGWTRVAASGSLDEVAAMARAALGIPLG